MSTGGYSSVKRNLVNVFSLCHLLYNTCITDSHTHFFLSYGLGMLLNCLCDCHCLSKNACCTRKIGQLPNIAGVLFNQVYIIHTNNTGTYFNFGGTKCGGIVCHGSLENFDVLPIMSGG